MKIKKFVGLTTTAYRDPEQSRKEGESGKHFPFVSIMFGHNYWDFVQGNMLTVLVLR